MLTEEPDIAAENARVRPEYAGGNRGFRGGQFGVIVNHNTLYSKTVRLLRHSAFRRDIPPLDEAYHGPEKPGPTGHGRSRGLRTARPPRLSTCV